MLTACDDNDDPYTPPVPVTVTEGLFVVNEGSMGLIDGSLTYIDGDGNVKQDAFREANGISLGDTPNDALIYGSKLYIAVTGENTVFVVNRTNLTVEQRISTTQLMGEDRGKQPRRLAAGNGQVYLSTFDGYVAAIDTAAYTAAAIYEVGSYPEGMALAGNTLYVANSDYGMGNASISAINLSTGGVAEMTGELITNTTDLAEVDGTLYALDAGTYDAMWNQTGAGIRRISGNTVEMAADATMMAVNATAGLIYTVNAPYTYPATPVTYGVYNMATGETSTFIAGTEIDSPAGIAVDPVSGDVYISSYTTDPDTGYASYTTDGYVCRYKADGTFAGRYEAGVGPTTLAFNYYITYE